VEIAGARGHSAGIAHYSSTSQITLRLLSSEPATVDRAFLARRLRAAASLRQRLVENSEACRLVYAEADLLPGLIVDRYGPHLSVQFLTQGMERLKPQITGLLGELFTPASIVERSDSPSRRHEGLEPAAGVLEGECPTDVAFRMNGLVWHSNPLTGQKTGAYLDQRENYAAAARYAHGEALDCFTCHGGFALHMAGRCANVEAVDSSAAALALAEQNRRANGVENVRFTEANVFDLLSGYEARRRRFDTIVLDPPAFAKSKSAIDGALRGYKEINLRALKMLGPNGVLVTCSCSHHVSEAMLLELLAAASLDAGRTLRVLERRSQSSDHPVLLTVPETLYLKCLIVEVV